MYILPNPILAQFTLDSVICLFVFTRSSQTSIIVLQLLKQRSVETVTSPPRVHKLERLHTIEREHKDALQRAVSLKVPHAEPLQDEPLENVESEAVPEENAESAECTKSQTVPAESSENKPTEESLKPKSRSSGSKTNWDELVEKLFKKTESGEIVLKMQPAAPE